MSGWKEVIEEGQVFYVHEELGTIAKTIDGKFVAMLPKVMRFGPFDTMEQAQQAFQNKVSLEQWLDQYNQNLVALCNQLRD